MIFALASFAATFATANWQVIALRGLTGVGAAFIMPGTLSILMNVFHDPRERQLAIAIWAGCAGLGGAIGPVVTGLLLAHFAWGSVFFINVVICAIALAAGALLLPELLRPQGGDPGPDRRAVRGRRVRRAPVRDHRGTRSSAGPPRRRCVTMLIGLVFLALFIRWELRNPHPMLDVRLFKVRAFSGGVDDHHAAVLRDVRPVLRGRAVPADLARVLTAAHRLRHSAHRRGRHGGRADERAVRPPLGASSGGGQRPDHLRDRPADHGWCDADDELPPARPGVRVDGVRQRPDDRALHHPDHVVGATRQVGRGLGGQRPVARAGRRAGHRGARQHHGVGVPRADRLASRFGTGRARRDHHRRDDARRRAGGATRRRRVSSCTTPRR